MSEAEIFEKFQIARGELIEALTIFHEKVKESGRDLEDELTEAMTQAEIDNFIFTLDE